ncbi:Chromate transport protein [Chitinispirillum alkaliphilum]|nr:Chromate transport protein [Chitinispirillum alkaliphilum]
MNEIDLFIAFFIIGIGAYGGGVAAIALIEHELVLTRQWLSAMEMSELIAVAQMTPGPIAINAATFAGYRIAGFTGALFSTLAVIMPSIILCTLIVVSALFIAKKGSVKRIRSAVEPAVFGLILSAVLIYARGALIDFVSVIIALATFALILLFRFKLHPLIYIAMGGLGGIIFL